MVRNTRSIKDVLADMKFVQLDDKYISAMAEVPFIWTNSSPRLVMRGGQFPQILKILRPDRKIVQTGYEFQIGKHSFKKIIKANAKIVGIVPRYKTGPSNDTVNKTVEITIFYIDLETKKLKHLDLTKINKIHSYFGFIYEWDIETIDSLQINELVREDLELAKSPNVTADDYYKFGCLLNTVSISSNEAAEDGMQIRRSVLDRFKFDIFIKVKFQYGANDVLANLYGTEDFYKPVPEIGDKLHKSGALVAIKKYDPITAPILLSNRNLMEFDPKFDKAFYVKGSEGVVEDIKVFYSPETKTAPFNSDVLLKYNRALREYYQELLEIYKRENKNNRSRFATNLEVDPNTHRLLVEAQAFCGLTHANNDDLPGNIKGYFRRSELNIISAEYTIRYTMTPSFGSKLSDSYASKSVLVDIIDDEFMPDGVDVIIEAKTGISRMIGGGFYEHYYSDASRQHKNRILNTLQEFAEIDADQSVGILLKQIVDEYTKFGNDNFSWQRPTHKELIKMLHSLDKDTIEYLFDMLLGFIRMFKEELYLEYRDATYEDKIILLYQVITEEIYIQQDNNTKKKPAFITMEVENSEYRPEKKHILFKEKDGRIIPTKDKIRIAPKYLSILCKLPEEMNSCSSPNYNHHGLPVQPSSDTKTNFPTEQRPLKDPGETEVRGFLSYLEDSTEALGTIINRANNMTNHASIYRQILQADRPTDIEELEETFEGNTIIDTITNTLRTAGAEFTYKEDNWYEK